MAEKTTELPEPAYLDDKTAIERIQAIVGNARTVWFAQIGFLAFIGLTLTSVRDLDFFSATATTQLPIVNIAIPTTTFFWSAAWLAAILHTYFHLYLLKLWDALAEAPPTIAGAPLGDRVFPWLVLDWALRHRPNRPTTPRPMDWLASAITWLVIWLATPVLVAAFWLRSMPAHDVRLTLAIGAAFVLSLFVSMSAWRRAFGRLRLPGLGDTRRHWRHTRPTGRFRRGVDRLRELLFWLNMGAALPLIAIGSLVGAGWHHLPAIVERHADAFWPNVLGRPPVFRALLIDAEIVGKPTDWVGRDTAERRFKIGWCRDRGLPPDACHESVEPYQSAAREAWCASRPIDDCDAAFARLDAAFAEEWQEQRGEYLANLTRPDLRGGDLRGASASSAFLANIDLRDARLDGAVLSGAQLEGADLSGARLERADLGGARLEGANLRDAKLDWANLRWARLEGADLTRARLERADLVGARLGGANLVDARLEGADLRGARLERAALVGARLEGAILGDARLEGADLRGARLERAYLGDARLEGTNLGDARLEGANLRRARLEGADLAGARLQSADWAGATFAASPAHSADFTAGRNLTQPQLAQVIGDADTVLPRDAETGEQLYVWTCWAEPPPSLDGLLRHWPEHRADLRAQWLCPPGAAPERTGRPAAAPPP